MIDRIWIYLLFPGLPMLALLWQIRRHNAGQAHLKRPLFSFRRPAGYSLQEKVEHEGESIFLGITAFAVSATLPGIVYTLSPSLELAWLSILVVPCAYFLVRLIKALPEYRNKRFGLLGEQITGAELDALQSNEVSAYHDLIFKKDGRTWNIDHVLLTPQGLLVVETKVRRWKRVGETFPNELTYDGERIMFPNGFSDTKAIRQVQNNASDLRGKIHAWTGGESVPVHMVLVYPGWKINRRGKGAVTVMSHEKLRQLFPLAGERIDKKTFAILKVNLERESRVILDDESKGSAESARAKGHHRRPQAAKRSRSASVASSSADSATA